MIRSIEVGRGRTPDRAGNVAIGSTSGPRRRWLAARRAGSRSVGVVVAARRIIPIRAPGGPCRFVDHGKLAPGRRLNLELHLPRDTFVEHYAGEMAGEETTSVVTTPSPLELDDVLDIALKLGQGPDAGPMLACIECTLRTQATSR